MPLACCWCCSIISWLIQDAAKVATYAFLRKYNIFGACLPDRQ